MTRIVRVRPANAKFLSWIALTAKAHWGYPRHWLELWSDTLTLQPVEIAANETFVAVSGGCVLGFYLLTRRENPPWLEHLWVLPGKMGRGVGRKLFQHAAARMRATGAKRMVIESDPHSAGFYLRMGARRTGTIRTLNAGVMRELPLLIYREDPTPRR